MEIRELGILAGDVATARQVHLLLFQVIQKISQASIWMSHFHQIKGGIRSPVGAQGCFTRSISKSRSRFEHFLSRAISSGVFAEWSPNMSEFSKKDEVVAEEMGFQVTAGTRNFWLGGCVCTGKDLLIIIIIFFAYCILNGIYSSKKRLVVGHVRLKMFFLFPPVWIRNSTPGANETSLRKAPWLRLYVCQEVLCEHQFFLRWCVTLLSSSSSVLSNPLSPILFLSPAQRGL